MKLELSWKYQEPKEYCDIIIPDSPISVGAICYVNEMQAGRNFLTYSDLI